MVQQKHGQQHKQQRFRCGMMCSLIAVIVVHAVSASDVGHVRLPFDAAAPRLRRKDSASVMRANVHAWAVAAIALAFLASPASPIGEEGTMTGNTYHIRGKVVMKEDTTTRPADILQQCFYGMGLVNCRHKGEDLPRLPPFPFNPESKFVIGNNYCIECTYLPLRQAMPCILFAHQHRLTTINTPFRLRQQPFRL